MRIREKNSTIGEEIRPLGKKFDHHYRGVMQYFAAAGENDDFIIAVINFPLNQYL